MKNINRSRLVALCLALSCAVSAAFPAFADTTSTISTDNGNATTAFTIDAAASQLSVTVPTALAISVSDQTVATAGVGTITNNSKGIVEIKIVKLESSAYTLTEYASQTVYNTYAVGSRKLGLSLDFGGTGELTSSAVTYRTGTDLTDGTAKALAAGTLKIAAKDDADSANTLTITPTASVSPTGSERVTGEAASLVLYGRFLRRRRTAPDST